MRKQSTQGYFSPANYRFANLIWLLLSLLVIAVDQYTKWLAVTHLTYAQPVPVLPFLNWTLLHNTGAAFSFLSEAGGWQKYFFVALAAVFSVVLAVWLTRLKPSQHLVATALALIIGGAIGNLYDRLIHGFVIDFVHLFYQNWNYPAFNIADSAIVLGAILLIIDSFKNPAEKPS